jgi:hypothetical protein
MTAVSYVMGNEPDKSALLVSKETDHPTAGQVLSDGIAVTASPGIMGYLNVMFSSTVSGVLTCTRGSRTEKLNGGTAIGAGVAFAETIECIGGETINFTFSADGGTYKLRVGSVIQR